MKTFCSMFNPSHFYCSPVQWRKNKLNLKWHVRNICHFYLLENVTALLATIYFGRFCFLFFCPRVQRQRELCEICSAVSICKSAYCSTFRVDNTDLVLRARAAASYKVNEMLDGAWGTKTMRNEEKSCDKQDSRWRRAHPMIKSDLQSDDYPAWWKSELNFRRFDQICWSQYSIPFSHRVSDALEHNIILGETKEISQHRANMIIEFANLSMI